MLAKWTKDHAAWVSKQVAAILNEPHSHSNSEVKITRRTNGLLAYGSMGAVIALTAAGELVLYDDETQTVSSLEQGLWQDVAMASLAKLYPDLCDLLPERPAHASDCPDCSGTGWRMDGRLFCGRCRGLGWLEERQGAEDSAARIA
jgi:hypothetical protein